VRRVAVLLLLAFSASACSEGGSKLPHTIATAGRNGLSLRADVSAAGDSLVVETVVKNGRDRAVYLDTDQCGRITEAVLVRSQFEPTGATWRGSAQAVKKLILEDQVGRQAPDRFAPRVPGDASSNVPTCKRPERPHRLAPRAEISERWELLFAGVRGLAAVGTAGTFVRVETVEARKPNELDFLDVLPTGSAERQRIGRNVHVIVPASRVADSPPTDPPSGPSRGELYDRLLANSSLRRWIQAQPRDGWRLAQLTPLSPYVATPADKQVQLRLVTTRYVKAAHAYARRDGTHVSLELPASADRTPVFARRRGTTPEKVKTIDEPKGFTLTQDVLAGSVALPSGRVVAGEYLFDEKPIDLGVRPGRYPVYATLAKSRQYGYDAVALGTLVLSEEKTASWKRAGAFAVDGGTASFISPEGVAFEQRGFDRDELESQRLDERIFDSLLAHESLVTNYRLDARMNLAQFTTGLGDGVYRVFVGRDAAGRATRVVMDFGLLHLAWPR
jgi:hypothetical protein